jgi:transcriptional regulator with XRE-family HTH domain
MIGKKIKLRRSELDLTQEQLGEMIGVTKVSICNWEKGIKFPSTENLIEMSKVLNVSIDYLIGNDQYVIAEGDKNYPVTMANEEIQLIQELRKHKKLYDRITDDPKRTIDLIERKIY